MAIGEKRFVLCVNTSIDGKVRPAQNRDCSFCKTNKQCAEYVRELLKDNTSDVFTTVETIVSQGSGVWQFRGERYNCVLFVLDWNGEATDIFYEYLAKLFKEVVVVCPSNSPMIDLYASVNGVSYIEIEMDKATEEGEESIVIGEVDEEDNDISELPIPYDKVFEYVTETSKVNTVYIISQSEIMNAEILMHANAVQEVCISVIPTMVLSNDVPTAFVSGETGENEFSNKFVSCDVSSLVNPGKGDSAEIATLIYKIKQN